MPPFSNQYRTQKKDMAVISAAIINTKGKVLVSKQYVPIEKSVILSLFDFFSRSVKTHNPSEFLENDNYRFLYAPYYDFNLVLITKKASNVVEDLNALETTKRLIARACFGNLTEESIMTDIWEVLFCLDDLFLFGQAE